MLNCDEIIAEHAGPIRRAAGLYARGGAERDDLVQEAVLAILKALPRYRGEASVRTYILRIAHHVGLRHALRLRRLRTHEGELVDVETPAPNPEVALLRGEELALINEVLADASVTSRQVLALTLEGCSQAEIGQVLGLQASAVAARLHRLREALRSARARRLG